LHSSGKFSLPMQAEVTPSVPKKRCRAPAASRRRRSRALGRSDGVCGGRAQPAAPAQRAAR
jgi:hypothetical protein